MTDELNELRGRLLSDLVPVQRVLPATLVALLWLGASVLYVLAIMLWIGPLRPGALQQLMEYPQFTTEMLSGVGSLVCLSVAAMRMSVPGSPTRMLLLLGWTLGAVWVGHIVVGLWLPPFAPSMLGKREWCVFEAYVYSVPPLVWALWLQRRRYVLDPMRTSLYAALAAGLVPALAMQVVCMYDPVHILNFHVAPVAALAAAVGAGTWIVRRLIPYATVREKRT
ncbi:MAG: NrsF family protein [Pseudomonadales bacterium]